MRVSGVTGVQTCALPIWGGDRSFRGRGGGLRRRGGGGGDRKVESTAGPGLALDPNPATHHGHQPAANAEAKTSPAKATRGGTIGLAERLENESLFLEGNADGSTSRCF